MIACAVLGAPGWTWVVIALIWTLAAVITALVSTWYRSS